jgi:hypothetical protein
MTKKMNREMLLDEIGKAAEKYEADFHGCGRSTLASLLHYFDLADEAGTSCLLKAALPLSGGIAQTKNTCAAAIGGMMAIGIMFFDGDVEEAKMDDIRAAMAAGREL